MILSSGRKGCGWFFNKHYLIKNIIYGYRFISKRYNLIVVNHYKYWKKAMEGSPSSLPHVATDAYVEISCPWRQKSVYPSSGYFNTIYSFVEQAPLIVQSCTYVGTVYIHCIIQIKQIRDWFIQLQVCTLHLSVNGQVHNTMILYRLNHVRRWRRARLFDCGDGDNNNDEKSIQRLNA